MQVARNSIETEEVDGAQSHNDDFSLTTLLFSFNEGLFSQRVFLFLCYKIIVNEISLTAVSEFR